ncbi:hypothetical protein D1Z98_00240 [Riemerella anatipestifer]|uniref:hypothetical protein n=1 Tax=Riemerella anatipestifer TaxID=34085 RepID=UPI00129D72AA|nr:hypothetical protein [Riemerella anatipestifer]MRM93458.1 hypothetical protein [Riemerella anatipestifer]
MVNRNNIYTYFGALLSQVITLLVSIFVLKNVAQEAYGRFSYFISFSSIIGSLATLKYEQSITISNSVKDSVGKVVVTVAVSIVLSFFAVLLSFFILNITLVETILAFVLSLSIAAGSSLVQLFLFTENHRLNGFFSTFFSLINLVLLYFLYKINSGLEISYVMAYFCSTIIFYILAFRVIKEKVCFSISDLIQIAKKNNMFPKVVFPSSIVPIILLYINPILLSHIFSEKEVGIFSFTIRILLLPVILVSSVSSGLFKVNMSKHFFNNNSEAFYKERKKMLYFLLIGILLCYPILIIILLNLENTVDIGKWEIHMDISLCLLLYAISQFLYMPFTVILLILKKNKLILFTSMILFILLLLNYLSIYLLDASFFVFVLSFGLINLFFSIYFINLIFKLKMEE